MQTLVDEHALIKRWLALIPAVIESLDLQTSEGREIIDAGIDFIRSYADKLHHGKEEDILFHYFDDTADIFRVIYDDHRQARSHVQAMLTAAESRDEQDLAFHLEAYRVLLGEHINKEDEILFPWLDRKLAENQISELNTAFIAAVKQLNIAEVKYISFVEQLERKLAFGNGAHGHIENAVLKTV
jgi:hemerythrin-like domain-containing protein